MNNIIIDIEIKPPFIKLEQFLKFALISETGGQAKNLISEGKVALNGQICTMRGKKLFNNDIIKTDNKNYRVKIFDKLENNPE